MTILPMKIKKSVFGYLMLLVSLVGYGAQNKVDPIIDIPSSPKKVAQDPFFRGLKRSPQYSSLRNSAMEYARQDDLRMLQDARYYRVIALYENEDKSKNSFLDERSRGKVTKKMQNGFYVPLGNYSRQQDARQEGVDFISNNAVLINNAVAVGEAIKDKKKTYTLEYGPFNSSDLARAACFYIKSHTNQFATECDNIKKHRIASNGVVKKTNSATVGLSQAGILQYTQNAMGFDPKAISEISLLVKEGESLGPQGFYVVRINQSGVHLASANGEVATIPAVTLPIHVEIKSGDQTTSVSESVGQSNKIAEPSSKSPVK